MLSLKTPAGAPLREFVEADTAWATVFVDDAAVVFVRRHGPLASVAGRYGYRLLRTGRAGLDALMTRCAGDPMLRAEVERECERQIAGSAYHAVACNILAELALMDGRPASARSYLQRALAADPGNEPARARLRSAELRH